MARGKEHFLLIRGERVVQLKCSGISMLNRDVEMRFILEGFGDLDAKLDTIRRLAKLYDDTTGNASARQGLVGANSKFKRRLNRLGCLSGRPQSP